MLVFLVLQLTPIRPSLVRDHLVLLKVKVFVSSRAQAMSSSSKLNQKAKLLLLITPSRNIAITEINPRYVWGGDAITLDNVDMVWIDRVTVC
jgi:hypothetical protein